MRGLPLMAGRGWMNGGANAARITWDESLRSRPRSAEASSKIATGGAPEARVPVTARGTSQGCQTKTLRPTGAPLPHGRKEGNEGGAPRLTTSGADESRLHH